MKLKLLKEFLKDVFLYAFFFYLGVFLFLFALYLESGRTTDILYAVLLSTFVFFIFLIIKLINYIRFHSVINALKAGAPADAILVIGLTHQQRNTVKALIEIMRRNTQRELELRQSNDEKYKIISQIVHNIKTPSSIIDLMLQDYRNNGESSIEVYKKIDHQNKAINENLDQILSYLRLDYFPNDYRIEEVELISLLRDKINMRKDSFILNNVYPKIIADEQEVYILTDRKWNGIILEQILSNAIKYSAHDEEEVITFRIEKRKDNVVLEIEDNGIGILPSDLKRVFEPFFTGENGRQVKSASGIGLYICQRIAKELNHKIQINSQVGKGTKVSITYLTKM